MLQPQALLLNKKNQKGGSLVEIVIVAGIIMSSLAAILGLAAFFLATSGQVQQTSQATALAQEAIESLRNYRDGTGWMDDNAGIEYDGLGVLNFSLAPFHLEQSTDTPPRWKMVSGAEIIDGFTREIVFEYYERDATTYDIGPGFIDDETVDVLVRVSWQERGRPHKVELVTILTNWNQ